MNHNITDFNIECLKLQSVRFASLTSLFENLQLQLLAELFSLCWLCSMAPARMSLMFCGCVCVAVSHRTGVDTVLRNHRFYLTSWNI